MEGRGERSQVMSSKGIASSVELTCCIFALKVVGDVSVIDVGYKMYLKLVSVGNKHALIVMPTYPSLCKKLEYNL